MSYSSVINGHRHECINADLFALSQRNQHNKLSASYSCEKYFSEEVIIMNQLVVSFKQPGQLYRLKSRNGGLNSKEYSTAFIVAQIDEVNKMTKFCETVVK